MPLILKRASASGPSGELGDGGANGIVVGPEHREVIDLVYYHGSTVTEVPKIVGINTATAKTRIFYARKRLAELVTPA